jgi:putative Mn2+ efflux pump MntP
MELLTIILIALGLAMDAFAVSVATGSVYKQLKLAHALRMALFFGSFQALMPIIGWLAGLSFKDAIITFDHWVAFGLLTAIGCKMIYESFQIKKAEDRPNPASLTVVLALAVATSIDALAVGITISLITSHIAAAIIIIGLITLVLSYLGCWLGQKIGHFFENKIEIAGGLILIGIGTKILLQHLLTAGP